MRVRVHVEDFVEAHALEIPILHGGEFGVPGRGAERCDAPGVASRDAAPLVACVALSQIARERATDSRLPCSPETDLNARKVFDTGSSTRWLVRFTSPSE